jgi:hypothetical protein
MTTVTANNSGSTTTWSWPAVTCASGTTANYRYDYTIPAASYDSGWVSNGTALSVAFTTSTGGYTYTVAVQADCVSSYTASGWSGSGSAGYYMAIVSWTTASNASSGNSSMVCPSWSPDGSKLFAADTTTGYAYSSINLGVTWTLVRTTHPCPIAYSRDGTKLIDRDTTTGYIDISTDSGVTWTKKIVGGGSYTIQDATISNDGTKITIWTIQIHNQGPTYYSTNSGTSWNTASGLQTESVLRVASADGTKLVAAYVDGSITNSGWTYIYVSTNSGASWTTTSLPKGDWYHITSSDDGTKIIAVDSNAYEYSSTDSGSTWTNNGYIPGGVYNVRGLASSSDFSKVMVLNGNINATLYTYMSTNYGGSWFQTEGIGGTNGGVVMSSNGNRAAVTITACCTSTAIYVGVINI